MLQAALHTSLALLASRNSYHIMQELTEEEANFFEKSFQTYFVHGIELSTVNPV